MKMIRYTLLATLLFAIAACQGGCSLFHSSSNPAQTPAQQANVAVFGVKGQFDIGLSFAQFYKHLPECPTGSPLCHNPPALAKLVAGANAADAAITQAENTVRAPGFDPATAAGVQSIALGAVAALLQIMADIERDQPEVAKAAPKYAPPAPTGSVTSTPAHS